jgi:branched-chain amino acid transport system permease protein
MTTESGRGPFLNHKALVFLVAALLCYAMPLVLNSYLLHVAILILLFGFLASAWNIVGGFAGQFCFGQAAFFGIGAYASSLLFMKAGISPWAGMAIGGILGAVLGGIIGYLTFRYKLKGVFFGLGTFAFAEMMRIIALNWGVTNKAMGVLLALKTNASFLDFQFGEKTPYYYVILSMVIMILLVAYRLDNSKPGFYLKAIREDEEAAGSLGINILKYKTGALMLSAFLTALGGTFYAQYMFYIDPDIAFGADTTVEMIVRAMFGGAGTVFGPLIGSAALETISECMRTFVGEYKGVHIMVYGAVLILVMIFFPYGVMGLIRGKRR